jgi:hypothetical protein
MIDPKNPSVLDARALDADHAPEFIVFHRQSDVKAGRLTSDWIMERVSDKAVMEHGPLVAMLALIGTEKYPNSRRSTWAEDTLRYRPASFYGDYDPTWPSLGRAK